MIRRKLASARSYSGAEISLVPAALLLLALARLALLRLARIPYRLSIGWRDDGDSLVKQPMLAHAWLEAGNRIVTGAPIQPELKPRLVFEG